MARIISKLAAIQMVLAIPALGGLSDGLAAYYDFETNLQDKSGNNRHLVTFSGSPEAAWAGGTVTRASSSVDRNTLLVGKALNLVDADADVLRVPVGSGQSATTAGSFNLSGNFTISAWHLLAPLPSNTSTRYFVFEGESNYDVSWGTTSGGDTYQVYNSQSGGATVTLTRGAWHHVVTVFQTVGTEIVMTTYVDGVSLGQLSAAATAMDFSRLALGDARSGTDRKWDGLIDEVAIWNRALSAAELRELEARGNSRVGLLDAGKVYVDLISAQPTLGTVSGSGLYEVGAQVAILAQGVPGYLFNGWSGSFNGQPAAFNHVVSSSASAVASFVRDTTDTDGDGLSNYDELALYGTNPQVADSDGDGIPDGDEIRKTTTDPISSDAALLARAQTIFGAGNTGGLVLSGPALARDSADGSVSLTLGLRGSPDLVQWTGIPLSLSNTSVLPSGKLLLTVPAPSPAVSIYEIRGRTP